MAGLLRTNGTTEAVAVRTANANTIVETGNFWNGSLHDYSTGTTLNRPGYGYKDGPTTVYGNSVLYDRNDDKNVALTDQTLVDGQDPDRNPEWLSAGAEDRYGSSRRAF